MGTYIHGTWKMFVIRHDKLEGEGIGLGFQDTEFGLYIVRV